MVIENFTPTSALLGGVLIGLSATLLMALSGRIAGVSSILGGLLTPRSGEILWRVLFLVGLVLGAGAYGLFRNVQIEIQQSLPVLILAGLLVGFGTQLGTGCTSGHGVCGLARFSRRSIAATMVFMATAAGTVYVVRHLFAS
jgi:uncharacterized protein